MFIATLSLSPAQIYLKFHCPVCGHNHWNRYWFNQTVSVPTVTTVNYNAQVAFTIPNHNDLETGLKCIGVNDKIRLYVAIHKDATNELMCCVSSAVIAADWWVIA